MPAPCARQGHTVHPLVAALATSVLVARPSLKLAKRVVPIVRLANFHLLGRLRARLVKPVGIPAPWHPCARPAQLEPTPLQEAARARTAPQASTRTPRVRPLARRVRQVRTSLTRKPRAALRAKMVRFPPPEPRHAPPALQESRKAPTLAA